MTNPLAPTEGGTRRIPFLVDEANPGTAYLPLGDGDVDMGAGRTRGTIPGASLSGRVSGGRAWARFADKFTPFELAALDGFPQGIWTPAAGKRFRLLGIHLKASVETTISLVDGTGGPTILTIGAGAATPLTLELGAIGILSAAADGELGVVVSVEADIVGTVFGTEET